MSNERIERPYNTVTWKQLAVMYPEFVQAVVQKFGPLPTGPVRRYDFERYRGLWESGLLVEVDDDE